MSQGIRENSYLDTLYKKYGDDFFKEEIRSDFLVTIERKQTWAVGLDLLEHLIEVCNRHNLRYFMAYGTLLGTVRHGGFIPWDDDMDILMPRNDYDKLEEYKDEFLYPFFLQTPNTDKYFAGSMIKIRNSETAFVDPTYLRKNQRMNMGMSLDIFPLDHTRKGDADEIHEEIIPLTLKCSAYMKHDAILLSDTDRLQVEQNYDPQSIPADLYKKINDIASRYKNDSNADYLAQFVNTVYDVHRQLWPETYFEETIQLPFEGVMVSVPREYDECLKLTYGNYMELPPVSDRGQWHGRLVFRPDTPYLQAVEEYLACHEEEQDEISDSSLPNLPTSE